MDPTNHDRQKLREALADPSARTFSDYITTLMNLADPDYLPRGIPSNGYSEAQQDYIRKVDTLATEFRTLKNDYLDKNGKFQMAKLFLDWACVEPEVIMACFNDAQAASSPLSISASLRLTSILERSLNNVILTYRGKTQRMMRDILASDVWNTRFSDQLLSFLKVLMGPPESLNIRNLLWHGFGSTKEQPERFAVLICHIFFVIGLQLQQDLITGDTMQRQTFANITTQTERLKLEKELNMTTNEYKKLDAFLAQVKIKSEEISQAHDYAKEGRYGLAVMMLLPSFEHIARVIFCTYNDCEERLKTAESSERFTTLDNMFKKTMGDGRTPNALYNLLPNRLHAALGDLLYYQNGFRLRDRLAHMEIEYGTIGTIAEEVWTFCYKVVSTTVLYLVHGEGADGIERYLIDDYVPLFHPSKETIEAVEHVDSLTKDLGHIVRPVGLVAQADEVSVQDDCQKIEACFGVSSYPTDSIQEFLRDQSRSPTFSSFRIGAKWPELLQKVAEHIQRALQSMLEFDAEYREMFKTNKCTRNQEASLANFHDRKATFEEIFRTLHAVVMKMTRDALTDPEFKVADKHKTLLNFSGAMSSKVGGHKWSEIVNDFKKNWKVNEHA